MEKRRKEGISEEEALEIAQDAVSEGAADGVAPCQRHQYRIWQLLRKTLWSL